MRPGPVPWLFRFIRLDGREERQDNGSMTNAAPRIAGIELGGTTGIALIAEGNRILDRRTYPIRYPETTLKALTCTLLEWPAVRPLNPGGLANLGRGTLDAGGSRFGHSLTTPTPAWRGETGKT